jgi:hypothetical protein
MKRILLLAALCLFSVPANASTVSFVMDAPYTSQIWTLDVLGFTGDPPGQFDMFQILVAHTGGPVVPSSANPDNISSQTRLDIWITGAGGSYMETRFGCGYSLSHCERGDRVPTNLGRNFLAEPQTLTILLGERISGPLASYGPLELDISFPDNVILGQPVLVSVVAPAVPEPSTWAMMLIGFALLGYRSVASVKRHPRRTASQSAAFR